MIIMHPQLNVAFLPQKLSNVQKSHRSAITSMKQTHILKNALKTGSRSYLAAQWVKDPALSLQQLRLLLWPRNLHRPQAWPKNKTNKQKFFLKRRGDKLGVWDEQIHTSKKTRTYLLYSTGNSTHLITYNGKESGEEYLQIDRYR